MNRARAPGGLALILGLLWPWVAHAERSLSLAEAIELAKAKRPEIAGAQVEVDRAKLGHLMARLAWIDLHLEARASAGYEASNLSTSSPLAAQCGPNSIDCPAFVREAVVDGTLSVPVWTGLANESRLAAADWRERSVEARQRATTADVVLDVVRAYWGLVRGELLRAAMAKELEAYRALEQLVAHQVSAGLAAPFEHNRVLAESLTLTAGLAALDRELAKGRAELGTVLELEGDVRLTDDPRAYAVTIPPKAEAEQAALAELPALTAADAELRAAGYDVRAAKGNLWPQVSLVGQAFAGVGSLPSGVADDHAFWGAAFGGVQLVWPIFDTLQTWRQMRDAELSERRAETERARVRLRALSEVRAAYADLTMSLGEKAPLEKAVELARSTVEVVRRRYASGTARLNEVLDVERELLRFEQNLISHAVNVAEADARLRAAMGRL